MKPTIKGLIGLLGLTAATWLGLSIPYTVNQTEHAIVKTFGAPRKAILNFSEEDKKRVSTLREEYDKEGLSVSEGAGLYFKLPWPIQTVTKIDRRYLPWNGYPEQIATSEKTYIWADIAAPWKVIDPLKYINELGTEDRAINSLNTVVDGKVRDEITSHSLIDAVRIDNRPMEVLDQELGETVKVGNVIAGRKGILNLITQNSLPELNAQGITIGENFMQGIIYIDDVKTNVEKRMESERLRIAERYSSEAKGQYDRIMGEKDRDKAQIITVAQKKAGEIRGLADAEATEIFANGFQEKDEKTGEMKNFRGFNIDPNFYNLWRTALLYQGKSLEGDTRLIIGTDNPLFRLMKEDYTESNNPKKK
ncbi:MAG: protease modulator HflC [archaeon]|nr:protease modulator HflC [archaeon]